MEESLSHYGKAVFHVTESANNSEVYVNSKRLLTRERLLKLKAKQKRRYTLSNAKKIKSKYRLYSRGHLKKDILAEEVLNGKEENIFTETTLNETTKSKLSEPTTIDKRLVWVMAAACGLSVANTVYAQPLLASMGHSFAVSVDHVGFVTTLSQLGYAIGLILIAPLGDKYNQRSLMAIALGVLSLALAAMAAAPTITLLILASAAVGLTSVLAELMIPFAASLASLKERGHIVGIMFSGVLVGILLANVVGGFVGEYLGWRAMYWIASGLMIALGVIVRLVFPNDNSAKSNVSYIRLLGSLWQLLWSKTVLQEISIIGLLIYGALNVFWVTISFFLEVPPYHYGSNIVGLFGLVGVAGACAASFVGKFTDHKDPRYIYAIALPLTLLSFVIMWLTGQWLLGLIIGTLLLDLGVQSNHIANETRVYTLDPETWNRANTIYIFMFCIGGSLGSVLGTIGWGIAKWDGVCGTGCLMLGLAFSFYALNGKRIYQRRQSHDPEPSNCFACRSVI